MLGIDHQDYLKQRRDKVGNIANQMLMDIIQGITNRRKPKGKSVVVVDYDKSWSARFEEIRKELADALGGVAIRIEHVGSTSVPGLAAKPIIDIDVVIATREDLPKAIQCLQSIGYVHEGPLGIPDRDAFKYEGKEHLQAHHLYVCPTDSKELYRHVTFRDYLRKNPDAVKQYSDVKKEGANKFPHDIDAYIRYKDACVKDIYARCGLD